MSGFDINRIIDFDAKYAETLMCPICLNIFGNPLTTKCGHTFCSKCLHEVIKTSIKQCPQCRDRFISLGPNEPINDNMVLIKDNGKTYGFNKNLIAIEMIDKLRIRCENGCNGCKRTVEIGLMSKHLRECEYKLCQTCGLLIGQKTEDHNCIETIRKISIDWKLKHEKSLKVNKKLKLKNRLLKNEIKEWKSKLEKSEQIVQRLKDFGSKYPQLASLWTESRDEITRRVKKRRLNNSDIVDCITDGEVDNHLNELFNGVIAIKNSKKVKDFRPDYSIETFGLIDDQNQQNLIRHHCRYVFDSIECRSEENFHKKQNKWIREAIIKAITVVRNCDWNESEEIFTNGIDESVRDEAKYKILYHLSRLSKCKN